MTDSFSEKQIRDYVRDELRRIIDAGLMYTFEADQQVSGAKPPGFKPASEAPIKPVAAEKKEHLDFNPNLCQWQPMEGPKGKYELAKEGTNYTLLAGYLKMHEKQSATLEGYFYWLFKDGNAVGRKPKGGA